MGIDSGPEVQIKNQEPPGSTEVNTSSKPKNISRRQFLKLAGMAGAAVALFGPASLLQACASEPKKSVAVDQEQPATTTIKETTTTRPLDYSNEIGSKDSRILVTYDGEHRLPKKATFLKTGETIDFNLGEVAVAWDGAISGKEPKCLGVFTEEKVTEEDSLQLVDQNGNQVPYVPSKEHPIITELPGDVVSEEKLKEYGVNIIQVGKDKFSPMLYIRESAFREGGVLEGQEASGKPINIVVIDGIALDQNYISLDGNPELEKIKSYLPVTFFTPESFTEEKILKIDQDVARTMGNIIDDETRTGLMPILMAELAEKKAFEDGKISKKQLLDLYLAEVMQDPSKRQVLTGLYGKDIFNTRGVYFRDENTIFIQAGKGAYEIDEYGLFVNKDGQVEIGYSATFIGSNRYLTSAPKASMTYPDPDTFKRLDDNPKGYVTGAVPGSPAYNFRHELEHLDTLGEGATDQGALDRLKEASDRWKKFGDNTGFSIVFSTSTGEFLVSDAGRPVLDSMQKAA
jgi:hypothetical protein